MARNYHFVTDCIHSKGEWIQDMVDQAKDITWRTFIKYVDPEEVAELFSTYSYHGEMYNQYGELTAPFHIKDDFAVSFCKSKYRGKPCVYISHSAIEHIFQP